MVHGYVVVSMIPVGSHIVRIPVRLVRSRVVVSAPPDRMTVTVEPSDNPLAPHHRAMSFESLISALARRSLRTHDKPRSFGTAHGSFELVCGPAVALVRLCVEQPREARAVALERVDVKLTLVGTSTTVPNPNVVRAAEQALARLPVSDSTHNMMLLPGQRAVVNFTCVALRPGTHSLHLQVQDLCHASGLLTAAAAPGVLRPHADDARAQRRSR